MKGLVCLLLLLETFVFVNGEERRQNPPQTDTDSQQYSHLGFSKIHAALRKLTATVKEQKANIRELTATVTELKENIRALETRLRDEMNKNNYGRKIAFSVGQPGSGYIGPFTNEITLTYRNVFTNIGNAYNPITGVFTAPLKGAYMFRISVYGHGGSPATAVIVKNGQLVVLAHADQPRVAINSSNGVVLILEVGDVVYVRVQSSRRIFDNLNNHNTFSGFLLFPL